MTINARRRLLVQATAIALTAITSRREVFAEDARGQATSKPNEPLPREAFAHLPEVSNLTISPDGQRLAGLLSMDDNTLLFTRALGGDVKLVPVLKTDNQIFRFSWIRWASNERLLVSVNFPSSRHFVGTTESRLMSIKPNGEGMINLVTPSPFDKGRDNSQIQDSVIDWLPEDGHHVLMQLATDGGVLPAVFKVNIDTGMRQMVHPPKRHVFNWITDATHRVRVGVYANEGKREILANDPDGKNWRTVWRYEALSLESVHPLGFGPDPQILYVLADHKGRKAVFKVDLGTQELKRELVLASPALDVSGWLVRSNITGAIVGIESNLTDEDRPEFWDMPLHLLVKGIDKALPNRKNSLRGFSQDDQRYVLYSVGNGIPGEYYVGNRQTGELALVGQTYADLPIDRLVGKHNHKIKSRDGLALQAYLTRPASSSGRLPLVILPHGGPQSRDDNEFDVWTEFMASRGYAVLQVNFRGSAGYGQKLMAAGFQRWGLEMQDDLTDAVQWAIQEGIADPTRVGIVGFSYGGYAALMGAIKTPDLYRCVVSVAGVSDLIDLWHHSNQYLEGGALLDRQMGNAWNDRERLKATSPVLHADQIKAPVLLIHGNKDRIVPVDQSEDMDKALKRAGKAHHFVELEGGDHQLSRNSHRLMVFKELEEFLSQHMGAPKVVAQP